MCGLALRPEVHDRLLENAGRSIFWTGCCDHDVPIVGPKPLIILERMAGKSARNGESPLALILWALIPLALIDAAARPSYNTELSCSEGVGAVADRSRGPGVTICR